MHNTKLFFACLAAAIFAVRAQDIDDNDIPPECRDICRPVVQLSQNCQNQFGDDDNDDQNFRNCICQAQNANIDIPNCDACVRQYPNYYTDNGQNQNNDDSNDDQDDVNQWLRTCNFPTTTLPAGFTTSPTSYYGTSSYPYGTQTSCYTATFTGYNNNGDDNDDDNNNGQYISTSVYCGNNGYSTGGYYGGGATPTSWSRTTYTSTYNNNGGQQTITSTALVGTDTNGNVVTTPTDATNSFGNQYTGGAGPIATALPYAGAGAGFLMLAFAI